MGRRRRGHDATPLRPFGPEWPFGGVTRLLAPPTAIDVTLDHGGAPIAISGAFNGSVDPIARWKVETRWWDRPVVREYWRALLHQQLVCRPFHYHSSPRLVCGAD